MGLKFQTLHGVVFSNAPLHGVKVSNLTWGCFRKWALHGIVFQTALFILEKTKKTKKPPPKQQKAHCYTATLFYSVRKPKKL